MTEFDDGLGGLLQELDDRGIADNTIVAIATDHGAETFSRDAIGPGSHADKPAHAARLARR